jgi:hypothetical protein
MNNTLGIEYAYTRIHKLEVEALAYKDKITELEWEFSVINATLELKVEVIKCNRERIVELDAETKAWSILWVEVMNTINRCARKEAWHDEHPLLVLQYAENKGGAE